jgi:hypothetical protein
MATVNPVGTYTGLVNAVSIASTTVSIANPAITYALTISAASGDVLAVDIDTDNGGHIKSMRVDAVVSNTTTNALAPTSILELSFPNNPPLNSATETSAVSVTLTV